VLASGEGSNLQALLDARLPVAAVASNVRDARALERARGAGLPAEAFPLDETGATVHVVDAGVDTGPVLRQEAVQVLPGDTPETLHARIRAVEHRLLPEVVRELIA
jgi:folate-dependent phosphoribosylglycinamide formyltransferase PurN